MTRFILTLALVFPAIACIAPSVVDPADRARVVDLLDQEWEAATADDMPGVYVSAQLTGAVANVLLKVVYLFEADGNYTGAALVDTAPPHFEVISGSWRMEGGQLTLDAADPAAVEVAGDRSLRITGAEGQVVLRREINQ